jgi:fructan beta-fructosidase
MQRVARAHRVLRKVGCGLMAATICIAVQPIALSAAADEVIFADFDGDDYAPWQASGNAFGSAPARGSLPGQMPVSGFLGRGLVNSFSGGDGSTGRLTSPEFKIDRTFVRFLIGGGGHPRQTCLNLLVEGETKRSATGPNTQPGGSEQLEPAGWDVSDLQGKTGQLQIVDDATGGWGHINVDQIVFTHQRPPEIVRGAARELVAEQRYLLFPVRNGAPKRTVTVSVDQREWRRFEIELADGKADWHAPLDIGAWQGQRLAIEVDKLPGDSKALDQLTQSDQPAERNDVYHEALRPGLHFSPRRGWNNDPNGLVFYQGRYHIFFQHNPYGWSWGNMHWGHALGDELIRWQEVGEALYPDRLGPMFSGSAVVDLHNTSGFGRDGKPPLVLIYTAAGNPAVQCLAYSNDGETFTKYEHNPVVEQITPGNRDPKVLWHEPSRRWIMVLYVESPEKKHMIHFLTSPDLKVWSAASQIEGFYECPDLFELDVEGGGGEKKWVLTAASSEYQIGGFDGKHFVPETPKLPGHRGRGFYAAQTFSDLPASDGRRIQIGWLQAASPGMPFNQCLSLPLKLTLRTTSGGPRLAWSPVAELERLRDKAHHFTDLTLKPGSGKSVDGLASDLLEIVAVIEPSPGSETHFDVRGVSIMYDAASQELVVHGHRTPATLRDGKIDMRILVDRTVIEVFADGGLTYVPMPVIPAADNRHFSIETKQGETQLPALDVYELRSIWR